TLTNATVAVSNGVFTVTLDFGANVFSGAVRFLEIGVRPAGSVNPYTVLAPRQPVLSTPYAIQTLNATTAVNFSGALAGDVTGTQSATSISNNAVTTAKLADGSVTNAKITDVAGSKLTGTISSSNLPVPLSLSGNTATPTPIFAATNAGTGDAVQATNSNTGANIAAVRGIISSTTPGGFSAGVRGLNNGAGGLGVGVYGSHAGSGWGVYGTAANGIGVNGTVSGTSGVGVYGSAQFTGLAGSFDGNVQVCDRLNIDQGNSNNGSLSNSAAGGNGLVFGAANGEGIASQRTAGGNQFGLDFYTAAANRMSISNSGNVGIGTTAPGAKLDVVGAINATTQYNLGAQRVLSNAGVDNLLRASLPAKAIRLAQAIPSLERHPVLSTKRASAIPSSVRTQALPTSAAFKTLSLARTPAKAIRLAQPIPSSVSAQAA
ncbi:MAG: hypothetical protein HYR56_12385, partial [Acidobacteria bacterium]|nr:hypothetical protein [Acidobacteriota bacterium]